MSERLRVYLWAIVIVSLLAVPAVADERGFFAPRISVVTFNDQVISVQTGTEVAITGAVWVTCGGLAAPFVPGLPAGFTLSLREAPTSELETLGKAALATGSQVNSLVMPEVGCSTLNFEFRGHAPITAGDFTWAVCMEPVFLDGEPVLTHPDERCGPGNRLIVSERARPDLVLSSPVIFSGASGDALDRTVATPGATMIVSTTALNVGQAEGESGVVTFFLDGSPMLLGGLPVTRNTGRLAADTPVDLRARGQAPSDEGRHTLAACVESVAAVDPEDRQEIVVENNCSWSTTFFVQAFQPGIAVVEKFDLQDGSDPSEVGFGYRIFNPGSERSERTTLHLYMGSEPSLEGATLLNSIEIDAIAPGGRITGTGATRGSRTPVFYNACIEDDCGSEWRRSDGF